jgi:hypothetical protein
VSNWPYCTRHRPIHNDAAFAAYLQVFGIHPLTTEDILLEETREKIELFRNYYLVCFRSFDQDPYSQTYLEPLNMYIIVFREGTLSVSYAFARLLCRSRASLTCVASFVTFIVPLPRHASSSKRPTPYQVPQRLHFSHFRLDLVCAHRRHYRRLRPVDPEYRIRGRRDRRVGIDLEGSRAERHVAKVSLGAWVHADQL